MGADPAAGAPSRHTGTALAPPQRTRRGASFRLARRVVVAWLAVMGLVTVSYAGLSAYVMSRLVYAPPSPIMETPASRGLTYHDVTFPARDDHVALRGWLIPGVLPDGSLTVHRTIIMVHGTRTNRTDLPAGLLDLSAELARHGFAVLAFDMRGMGESPPAPITFGIYEQRDVLGAVDFLRSGPLPYPELGRPRVIGGWGVSMGGATLLFAAAREPAMRAVVSDSAYADFLPIIERQLPRQSGLPPAMTLGVLAAGWVFYGADYFDIRPVDVIGQIAPRPILLIQGTRDGIVPPSNEVELYQAARAAPSAHVSMWQVPGADHAQSFHTAPQDYVDRLVAFYTAALGDTAA